MPNESPVRCMLLQLSSTSYRDLHLEILTADPGPLLTLPRTYGDLAPKRVCLLLLRLDSVLTERFNAFLWPVRLFRMKLECISRHCQGTSRFVSGSGRNLRYQASGAEYDAASRKDYRVYKCSKNG